LRLRGTASTTLLPATGCHIPPATVAIASATASNAKSSAIVKRHVPSDVCRHGNVFVPRLQSGPDRCLTAQAARSRLAKYTAATRIRATAHPKRTAAETARITSLPVHSLTQPGAGSATARRSGITVKAAKGPPSASTVDQIGPALDRPKLMTISVITNASQAPADHHPALKRRASITSVIRQHSGWPREGRQRRREGGDRDEHRDW
jgi:hypothetical protein